MSNIILPYQKLWFSLEDYKKDFKAFGKPFLEVVPAKWKKEFNSVEDMYKTIMLDLQFNANMYFNNFFDHVNLEQLRLNLQELIKYALFHSFASKLYGVLFANKNLKTSFSTNTGYSITQDLTRNTGSYLDLFTPESLRALALTNIRQLMDSNNNDWEKTLTDLGELNFDYIYTKQEIDELLEILKIEIKTMIETIANWVEERLQIFGEELPKNEEFIEQIEKEITKNEEFSNKIGSNLLNNPNFIDETSDKVIGKDDFIDRAGTNIAENDTFIGNVADKLAGTIITQEYVDNQDKITLTTAKKYADDQDIVNLTTAKKYADDQDIVNLTTAKKYADDQDIAIKKYADDQDIVNLTTAKKYTDDEIKKKEIWIKGEYKYMEKGSEMPAGWVIYREPGSGLAILSSITTSNRDVITAWQPSSGGESGVSLNPFSGENYGRLRILGRGETGSAHDIWLVSAEIWQYNPTLYNSIIAMGLTPREYDAMQKEKNEI